MTVCKPSAGHMLLDTRSIRGMTQIDLDVVKATAKGHGPDRKDAQRTLQRGLDNGALRLGRSLEIELRPKPKQGEEKTSMDPSNESESEKKRMNVRTILTHEPRLGDSPSLMKQPSIESIVLEHYNRVVGEGQGAILADMYLEKIREAASDSTDGQSDGPSGAEDEARFEPIDGRIAREYVANMVRMAVIRERKPQTRVQIAALINHGVFAGTIFDEAPELRRPFAQGGLVGTTNDALDFVSLMIRDNMLTGFGDGFLAEPSSSEGAVDENATEATRSTSDRKTAQDSSGADGKSADTETKTTRTPPAFSLSSLLSEIGVDLKVGNMDIISGVEKASRTGNAAPLMAGLAGVLLSAVANADSKKPE